MNRQLSVGMGKFEYRLIITVFLISFAFSYKVNAQQPLSQHFIDSVAPDQNATVQCAMDRMLASLRRNPEYKHKEDQMNLQIRAAQGALGPDTIITLPVVVHIINTNPYAISDAQVYAGIQLLNDAFSKSGVYAASAGADTKIRFCLAKTDPDTGITTGITRTTSFFSNSLNKDIEDARLKNLIQWDPKHYINIWLITGIEAENYATFSCGSWTRARIGGYATMPPGGSALDGIVVPGFGSILAHEMGHYLGLYHTFEGGCYNFDCTTNGDMVCDTPPDNSKAPGCTGSPNSCNTDTLSSYSNGFFHTDVPDQVTNFMDYGNASCANQFTQGQADRMRAAIITQRAGLLQNKCNPPCSESILAGFTRDIAYSVIGNTINFTNTSFGATKFEWLVNDTIVSTAVNFAYTFNESKKDKVTLKAYNTPGCFAAYTSYVLTGCGVTARFYTDKQIIASKTGIYTDSILFTNTSYNGLTYQWLMSNDKGMTEQVVSTNMHLKYIFPDPANYKIRLVATNGSCSDTTEYFSVPVADPTADGSVFSGTYYCYGANKVNIHFCIADYGYAPVPKGTPVSFYDADPRFPGANKISPDYYLPYAVPGGNCYVCFNHVLNVTYKGLEQIFISINDSGKTSPVVFPNTAFPEMSYLNNITIAQTIRTTIYASICQGKNYAGYTTAGTYIDTLVSVNNGCDSIRTLVLTVRPVAFTTVTTSICAGDNYAGHTTSGTYVDVYSGANACDSTRTLHLTVKPVFKTTLSVSICEGQNYYGHTKAGTYTDHYFATNGCDSARTVYLTVRPIARTTIYDTICAGQNHAGHTASGTYVDTYFGVNGCDSIRTLHLTVNPVYNTTVTTSICQGQNYAGHTTSGTYIDIYTASNGCDSTRILHLTVNPVKFTSVTTAICAGENYAGHTTSGVYVDVYPSAAGCDSTRTLYLTVKPTRSKTVTAVICDGEVFEGYTSTGIYVDVFKAENGCDSTRTLYLTVKPVSSTIINAEICQGETYLAGGNLQTVSGTYYDTLTNYLGCDSIITTKLIVHPLPQPDLGKDRGICIGDTMVLNPGNFVSYLWQDGSTHNTYSTTATGHYWVKVLDNFGCSATATLHILRVDPLPKDFLRNDTSLCRGNTVRLYVPGFTAYLWSTGETSASIDVTKSGTYQLKGADKNGCRGVDSVKIFFYDCKDVWIPNAFTPDKNGTNEIFRPIFPAPVTNFHIQIRNRPGKLVFESTNPLMGWDGRYLGTEQPIGVYVYVITFRDIDGRDVIKKGTVTIVR